MSERQDRADPRLSQLLAGCSARELRDVIQSLHGSTWGCRLDDIEDALRRARQREHWRRSQAAWDAMRAAEKVALDAFERGEWERAGVAACQADRARKAWRRHQEAAVHDNFELDR